MLSAAAGLLPLLPVYFYFLFLFQIHPIQGISSLQFHSSNRSLCPQGCSIDENCATNQGCFRLTVGASTKNCCLGILRPNDEGCLLDEQCARSCEGSTCDFDDSAAPAGLIGGNRLSSAPSSRCVCPTGTHVLFHTCWIECPSGFLPRWDSELGMSRCSLNTGSAEEAEEPKPIGWDETTRPNLLQIWRERPGGQPKTLYC